MTLMAAVCAQRQYWMVSDSVVSAEVDGETVLLDLNGDVYFGLDAVGADVWNLLGAGATEDMLVARLLEMYDVDEDRLRADVHALVATLRENNLVRPVDV